ncbi:MAG: hypothetical protein IPL53_19625 [Ignavibacteria bacterium]|nr:hypothetical protein [Ignavibacteria bacterium]
MGIPQTGTINVTAIPEGFYDNVPNTIRQSDVADVAVFQSTSPYSWIQSSSGVIDSVTLTGSFQFTEIPTGSYYLAIYHRNSIETWSNAPVNFISGGTVSYDFSNAVTKAFGSNLKQVDSSPPRFGLYSGDVNQDAIIDAADLSNVENDADASLFGYVNTDVTGDNFVDAADISIVENNVGLGVIVITP